MKRAENCLDAEPISTATATEAERNGLRQTVFAGCNYLGLAHDPRVQDAARVGIDRLGLSASASRRTSGNTEPHAKLEAALGAFFGAVLPGTEAILTLEGLTANLVAMHALSATHGVAVIDERAHSTQHLSARAAGLAVLTYPHLNVTKLARMLEALPSDVSPIVSTDGVFATDGGVAPLREILACLPEGGALVVDDCHGVGVLGERGRGTLEHLGIRDERVVLTTTLAKGVGCAGGVVVGSPDLIERARRASPAYVGTTPTPPPIAAAAFAALGIIDAEPERVARVRENARHLQRVVVEAGFELAGPPHADVPVVSIVPESAEVAERVEASLERAGLFVPLIDYPGGPAGMYFRASVTSEHTREQIDALGCALKAGALVVS